MEIKLGVDESCIWPYTGSIPHQRCLCPCLVRVHPRNHGISRAPEEIARQKAHASDFNADGLSTFCIVGEIVLFAAVMLRVYSRRIAQIPLQADDFTLIVAIVLSLTAVILFDVRGKAFQSLEAQEMAVIQPRSGWQLFSVSLWYGSTLVFIRYSDSNQIRKGNSQD